MVDFPTAKSLNETLGATPIELTKLAYKKSFHIRAHPENTGNIIITAGDNDIVLDVLVPGEPFTVLAEITPLYNVIRENTPLKISGTNGDKIVGFVI